ncbi:MULTISPECIES: sigma-70 family RNA polymerase sigma factor [Chryseobacterium]|uniref:RNA polymerase sigma-70 factor (ECF subfamily) n=1 Tax=Chryseobacterium geocarposphaerae TaxID=1416776 RepID=A0ABU1LA16_9FLAO|nr:MULTISPECIES: sigma-70 family RNA polymerase sigma factor [Chryseobacterium]MDR6403555.1 RNA polymerase sigma-70 factor (ECF subfamily) [Chryseobacterium geocarposphaerae]MDR6697109.1 RNA polymerase sigma-70 factor (ECF subfamily) [Chryseobacterium ginsenosidimutans]
MTKNETIKSWVEQYSGPLLRRAVYLLSDKVEAEDVVQEVFIAAVSSFDSFEGKSQPLTWLMTILNRKVADFYRKKYKSDPQINLDHFFDETGSWKNNNVLNDWDASSKETELLDDKDFNKTLEDCIEDLPSRWKIPMKMYYLEEKKAPEVSQELNISTTNLWKILQRSRMQLRECLEFNWFAKL